MKTLFEFVPRMIEAFRKKNQRRLRKLNDDILSATAIDRSEVNLRLAILAYVLSKIVSKPRFLGKEFEPCISRIEILLEKALHTARGRKEEEILAVFSEIEKEIACFDKKDPRFVITMMEKGRLKMGATFYAQGMSLGVASELTGIDKQELLDYAGQTMMFDRMGAEMPIHERLKHARSLIGG